MQLSLHSFYLLENACAFTHALNVCVSSKGECGGSEGIAVKDAGAVRLSNMGGSWGSPESTKAQTP